MINLPSTLYVGWDSSSRKKTELFEAALLPYGESVAEKNKLEKFTEKFDTITEYDNVPLPGFTLYDSDKKTWGSLETTWLVIDPRGFLVRITSDDLADILRVTGITEGLIQEKCIWCRNDSKSQLKLMPVSANAYTTAKDNTHLLSNKVHITEVNIGDTVLLQNELTGVYMGVMSLYGALHEGPHNKYTVKHWMRHQIVMLDDDKFHHQANVKILSIIKKTKTPLTRENSIAIINAKIASGFTEFSIGTHFSKIPALQGYIRHASIHSVYAPKLELLEISKEEAGAIAMINASTFNNGCLILEEACGKKYIIDYLESSMIYNATNGNGFSVIEVIDNEITDSFTTVGRKHRKINNVSSLIGYPLDYFSKFYKIAKHIKTERYI